MQGDWIQEEQLRKLAQAKSAPGLSDEQRAAVERVDALLAMKSARPATRVRFACKARKLGSFLNKPFGKATRKDLANFFTHIAQTHTPEGMRYVKSFVRRFYTLLLNPYEEKLPKLVSWIDARKLRAEHRKPQPVLKPEEILRLLSVTKCARDRALISVLFESGTRISELCGLSVGDVTFDEYGARILVDGKTGVRRVRLIQCVPDLRDWINVHPFRSRQEVPLFIHQKSNLPKPLMPQGVRFILKDVAKRAGIQKRVNPHAFRKARATDLAQSLTPSELSIYHGWVQGSAMPQVYIHLTGDDVERKLLRQAGLLNENEGTTNPLKPVACPRCQTENPSVNTLCSKCALVLDKNHRDALAKERDELAARTPELLELLEDSEVNGLLLRKMAELRKQENEKEAHSPVSYRGASQMPNARRASGQRKRKNVLVSRGSSARPSSHTDTSGTD